MGAILERLQTLAQRSGDLSPLRESVRRRLLEGNAQAILAGQTPQGQPVRPLAASTLRRRKGTGPPRAPRGRQSRVIAGYVVQVEAGPGLLRFLGSWPGFPAVEYLDRTRPTLGFRPEDLDAIRAELRTHVMR